MSTQTIVVVIGVIWVVIGLGIGVYMGRRGHTAFGWGVIGCVLGPLAIVLVAQAVADEPNRAGSLTRDGGIPGRGSIDVLVGVDGSPEAAGAARAALELLGPSIRRLTLAAVLDFDRLGEHERELRQMLDHEADRVDDAMCAHRATGDAAVPGRSGTALLTGRPDQALAEHAATEGYDLVVIGSRGAGLSKAVLGSVASRLAGSGKVPVLIAPSGAPLDKMKIAGAESPMRSGPSGPVVPTRR
jgi:nucleotide-binding universal stress UspA family protein